MKLAIRTRLTLIFTGLVALVLIATGLFVYSRVKVDLRHTVDAGLKSRADTLVESEGQNGVQFGEGDLIDADEAFAQIVSSRGTVVESRPAIEKDSLVPPNVIASISEPTYLTRSIGSSAEPFSARLLVVPTSDGGAVIVGASLEQQQEAISRLGKALVVGGAGALSLSTLIAWLLAGAALKPVERMRAEAADISADNPGRRLAVPQTGDEIARLGQTLNEMLVRLEQAMERERRFVDDASHELRTPLGILKTELELALRRARTPEELEAAIRSAAEESDRLIELADSLLVLARAERDGLPIKRQTVDLARLAEEVASGFESEARRRGVLLSTLPSGDTSIQADPARMYQALSNLIENALRYTSDGGTVTVLVTGDDSGATIEVIDNGPGFAEDLVETAFQPFTRGDAGRGRVDGGTGLGLAIVKAIAEGHGGEVRASNGPRGGALVTIHIPQSE